MRLNLRRLVATFIIGAFLTGTHVCAAAPTIARIRVAIVGLEHGHVAGFLQSISKSRNVELIGIAETDSALAQQYAAQFHLDRGLFFTDAEKMVLELHPDAVLVYTNILDHRKVIEVAARHGVNSMVEKPLATTVEDAVAIRRAAREHRVHVLVNYETTRFASNAQALEDVKAGKIGEIRRAVFHDGNRGPKEMHLGPEFTRWLTDPAKNGAGAMFDFGCYGADLMTVLMRGEAPISVTAVSLTDNPNDYPKVDDDSTIILRYP